MVEQWNRDGGTGEQCNNDGGTVDQRKSDNIDGGTMEQRWWNSGTEMTEEWNNV